MSFDLPALPHEWSYVPLDRCSQPNSITYGVVQPGSALETGKPLIRVNNFRDTRIDLSDVMFIAPEIEAKYSRTRLKGGEVLLTIVGSVGQVAVVPRHCDGFNVARAVAVIHPLPDISADWIALCLRSPLSSHLLVSRANTTVQTTINLKDLRALPIPLPPADERHAIADFVGALDDRITLLRETNTTLEGIAQALFKSWFVDFDPVRAKAEGSEPEGMDQATAEMFPDAFEESEFGLVPRGWAICSLDQHVSAERGLSYKGSGLAERGQGVPMHNLNSVLEGGGYKYPGIKFYNGVFKDKHLVKSGEIIVANTEQGHEHRLIGFPAIVPRTYAEAAIFSHHIYRVRLLEGSPLSISFLYRTLMTPSVREQIIGCANGSTVNMLKVIGLQTPKFVCPSSHVCKAYELIASPIQNAIEANVERVEILTILRDTLLPRLISGQLRIPEATEELMALAA